MPKPIQISILLIVAYFGISCFCKGPELTKDLINKSDIVFEGKLIRAVPVEEDKDLDDLLLTFKVVKIYKGKQQDTIQLKSSLSSCGFIATEKSIFSYLDMQCIVYSNKSNGHYRYTVCGNRIVSKSPRKIEPAMREYYTEDPQKIHRYDSMYQVELKTLTALIEK